MGKVISHAKSLEGWDFWTWFVGNWKTIKEFVKVGFPYLASTFFSSEPVIQGSLTILGKFVLDMGEYWYKEYTA